MSIVSGLAWPICELARTAGYIRMRCLLISRWEPSHRQKWWLLFAHGTEGISMWNKQKQPFPLIRAGFSVLWPRAGLNLPSDNCYLDSEQDAKKTFPLSSPPTHKSRVGVGGVKELSFVMRKGFCWLSWTLAKQAGVSEILLHVRAVSVSVSAMAVQFKELLWKTLNFRAWAHFQERMKWGWKQVLHPWDIFQI